jgi:S-adenosylmethionine synthetase
MAETLLTAEYVFPGHPDKLCDAIADALVAEALRRESRALVGVEVAAYRNRVFITGRIACDGADEIGIDSLVRDVYRSAGYSAGWGPASDELIIETQLCLGPLEEGEAEVRELSDDQAICVGYAIDIPETNYLPVEHWLACELARRLHSFRADRPDLELGPDGKVLVVVRQDGRAWSLREFSCSLQQQARADEIALRRAVRGSLEEELARLAHTLPGLSTQLPDSILVNAAGPFELGGPEGDNGLSGKKLVADAYGPRVPIGGGAWSGKDFFKADRAGGLHSRRLAKLAVKLGLASEVRVTLGYLPGDRAARVYSIRSDNDELATSRALADIMDLRLVRSGEAFSVPDLLPEIARWGHFTDPSFSWEMAPRL